jgi:YVTN family beta-propeller protein
MSKAARKLAIALALLATAAALAAPAAMASFAYVVNISSSNVSVIDTATNKPVTTIPVAKEPRGIAIAPDGLRAYVVSLGANDVSVIDTATNKVVTTIPVGEHPIAIAITPDGRFAYVSNAGSNTVSVINLATNEVVGKPIPVGITPVAIAVNPDGLHAYTVNEDFSSNISAIDTTKNETSDAHAQAAILNLKNLAITPDGSRAYATSQAAFGVFMIDTKTNEVVGSAIDAGDHTFGIAVTPDGTRIYATLNHEGVAVIDTKENKQIGNAIRVGKEPSAIAITPNGSRAYVANQASNTVSVIDTATNSVMGEPIAVGEGPGAIAIAPDQPPTAAFSTPSRIRPGVPFSFDASATKDRDGQVATYAWSFGDGQSQSLSAPTATHTFAKPGTFNVSLAATDSEGCSVARKLVFTGATPMGCSGSAAAATTKTITVAFPGVKLSCPKKAKPKGCSFKLQVIDKKPKKGKKAKKPKLLSALAKAKVKAGRSAIVSIQPKAPFAAKLASAQSFLVKETAVVGGKKKTRVVRLKVVQ